MHDAVLYGSKACVQILLAARAQVELLSNDGRTALAYAIQKNHRECAELLLHAGAKLRNVNVPIPDWMNEIILKYNNFKAAYTVLYGVLRRRVHVPFLFNLMAAKPPDIMLLICAAFLDNRFDDAWEK